MQIACSVALLCAAALAAVWVTYARPPLRPALVVLAFELLAVLTITLLWPRASAWIALVWPVAWAGMNLSQRLATRYFLAALVTLLVGWSATAANPEADLGDLLWPAVVLTLVLVVGIQRRRQREYVDQIRRMIVELKDYSEQLEEAHRQLQVDSLQAAALAAAEERNRIAREIHDVLAHSLTVIVVQAQAIKKLIRTDPAAAEGQAETVAQLAREGLQEARRSVSALRSRSAALDGLGTLRSLVEEFGSKTSTETSFEVTGQRADLSPNAWATLYRVVQEALTNAHRHGRARRIDIRLQLDGVTRLLVDDDGVAPPDTQVTPGNGLIGMTERASRQGGTIRYGPRPDGGFHVELELPT